MKNTARGERMIHVRREFGSKGEHTDRAQWLEDLRKFNPDLTYNKVRGLEEGRSPKNSIDEIAKGLAGCPSLIGSGYKPMQVMGWVLSGEGEKPIRKALPEGSPHDPPPRGSGRIERLEESDEGDVVVLEPNGVARVSASKAFVLLERAVGEDNPVIFKALAKAALAALRSRRTSSSPLAA